MPEKGKSEDNPKPMSRAGAFYDKCKEFADKNGEVIWDLSKDPPELVDGRGRDFKEEERLAKEVAERKKLDELTSNGYLVGKILTQHLSVNSINVKEEVKEAITEVLNPKLVTKKLTKKQQFEDDVKQRSAVNKINLLKKSTK